MKNWNISILLNNARKIDLILKLIDELLVLKHNFSVGSVVLFICSFVALSHFDIFVKVSSTFFCFVRPKGD